MSSRIKVLLILNVLIIVFCNQTYTQNTLIKEILWTIDWSPDGKYIATGGNIDSLKIYSEKNLKPHISIPIKNTITRVKWHPSKNLIAVSVQNSENKIVTINLDNKEQIELKEISPDGARGIAWNYSGEYLAVGDNEGQILIYNLKGELIKKFENQSNSTKSITAIDWHPKKNIITTVADKIRFFDLEGNLLLSIKHRPEDVLLLCVAWHKSGEFLVTGDYGDKKNQSLLQYWSAQGKLIKSIAISKCEYRNLAWNPKGNRLASASDELRVWDTEGNLISVGDSEDYLWGIAWNKQGNRIITSSLEQRVVLWNKKARPIIMLE